MNKVTVALAVIVKNNRVLLTLRNDPARPSIHLHWQLPGGGVKKGETLSEACIREAQEETGLSIKILSQKPYVIHSIFEGTDFVLCSFLAEAISGTINSQKDEETADAKWMEISEVKKLPTLQDTETMINKAIEYARTTSTN